MPSLIRLPGRTHAGLIAVAVLATSLVPPPNAARAATVRADVDLATINHRSNRPRYHAVGRFDTDAARRSLAGTGTLVADQWVLTAAHVLDGMNTQTFTLRGQTYNVEGWTAPRGYVNDPTFFTDIALVKLDRPVTGIEPAKLYRTNNPEINRTAMILGYGYSGHGDTGENNRTAQTLRLTTNRIETIDSAHVLRTDFDNPAGGFNPYAGNGITRFEGGLTPGDSGAPAFIFDGHDFTLGGIGVYADDLLGGPLDGNYGEENGLLRVRSHIDWIDSVIAGGVSDRELFLSNLSTYQGDLEDLLANTPNHPPIVGWTSTHPTGTIKKAGGTLEFNNGSLVVNPGGSINGEVRSTVTVNGGVTLDPGVFATYNLIPTQSIDSIVGWSSLYPTGQIEQGDLDAVLQNWGQTNTPEVIGWTNHFPTGQTDLDMILTNWGDVASPSNPSPLPEPAAALIASGFLSARWRRKIRP